MIIKRLTMYASMYTINLIIVIGLLFVAILIPTGLFAEIVYLRSGETIEGNVTDISGLGIMIHSAQNRHFYGLEEIDTIEGLPPEKEEAFQEANLRYKPIPKDILTPVQFKGPSMALHAWQARAQDAFADMLLKYVLIGGVVIVVIVMLIK